MQSRLTFALVVVVVAACPPLPAAGEEAPAPPASAVQENIGQRWLAYGGIEKASDIESVVLPYPGRRVS